MARERKFNDVARIPISFEREDLDFVKEYCFAHSMSVNEFINETVVNRIREIRLEENLEQFNK